MSTETVEDVLAKVGTKVYEQTTLAQVGIGAGALGFALGAGVGYLTLKRKLEKKFAEVADEEIAEMRRHFHAKEALMDADQKPDLEALSATLGYAQTAAGASPDESGEAGQRDPNNTLVFGKQEMTPEVAEVVAGGSPIVAKSIFDTPQPSNSELYPEWDWETEKGRRTEEAPYVIHKDEFDENEDISAQHSWTYYAGDGVLADERDVAVDNVDEVVGLVNLEKFGHGSGSPDVVFVRNVPLQMEFEVVKSTGKHAHEVMGLDAEERYQDAPSPFPRRGSDEDGRA